MSVLYLLLLLAATGGLVHVTRFWPRVASVFVLAGGSLLVGLTQQASLNSLEIVSVTLALEPSTRDLLTVVFTLTILLALAGLLPRDRIGVSFLFWPWIPWVVALTVNDFVVAVFSWSLGMVACVLAMKPRKYQRTSGAAFFLVLITIATTSLLLANRFIALYPLTPERTELIQLAVLFVAWGMSLYFGIFPFHLWVPSVADDAPLPVLAAILGFGQPIGLWLLVRLLSQYPWIIDKSNLLPLFALGGAVAILAGGLMAAVERRSGRLLGYAAMFAFGFALINVGQASREGMAYGGLEVFQRGISLTVLAVAVTVAAQVSSRRVQQVALLAFVLAGLGLIGLRLGVSFAGRWNVLADWAGRDTRLWFLVLFAHAGLLVGLFRFARHWHLALAPAAGTISTREFEIPLAIDETVPVSATAELAKGAAAGRGAEPPREHASSLDEAESAPVIPELVMADDVGGNESDAIAEAEQASVGGSGEYDFEAHVRELVRAAAIRWGPTLMRLAHSMPGQFQRTFLLAWRTWREWMTLGLLILLIALLLIVGLEPGLWFNRILETLGSPPFVQ